MPSYLVEVYVPRMQAQDTRNAGRRARATARQLAEEGASVRYVRTTLLPGDETCFHLFEAESEDTVARVRRRAGLASARIASALE
jgi:hypothetical protein